MSFSQIIPYSDENNYSKSNSILFDWTSGTDVVLTDSRPTNATCNFTFNTDKDSLWGNGTLTGTLGGGATVAAGVLNTSGAGQYWEGTNDGSPAKVGAYIGTCIIRIVPAFTGSPAGQHMLLQASNGSGNNTAMNFYVDTDGEIKVRFYTDAGVACDIVATNGASFTNGTVTEIALVYSLSKVTTGSVYIYQDGVLLGSNTSYPTAGSITRDVAPVQLNLSNVFNYSFSAYATVNSFHAYSVAKYSNTTYTVEGEQSETIYSVANPWIMNSSGITTKEIVSFTPSVTVAGSDLVKYIFNVGGIDHYWSGAAWTASNGTYSQSNTAAEITTNIAAFNTNIINLGKVVKIKAFLHSDDGSTTPELDSITIIYNYGIIGSSVLTCVVYGIVNSVAVNPDTDADITVFTEDAFYYDERLIAIRETTTTNSEGEWQLTLAENETYGGSYGVTIEYDDDGTARTESYTISVPNQDTAKLADIIVM